MSAADALTVTLHVARTLESLEIPYFVGGSMKVGELLEKALDETS